MAEIRIKEELKPCPKAVLVSIQPRWCRKIASGEKTIEVRKTRPNLETPFKCYIYETKGKTDTPWMDEDGHMDFHGCGMVIGEFMCKNIDFLCPDLFVVKEDAERNLVGSCISPDEFKTYMEWKGKKVWECNDGFGWHISELKIYDEPEELHEFYRPCAPACSFSELCGGVQDGKHCPFPLKHPPQSWCYVAEH